MSTKWTIQQEQAIRTVDRNLLVSAAAGSGKTSVLAERCAYLVCDAPEGLRCDVDELLVVTFTVAAANEMRGRIAAALNQRFTENADPRLARQIALLDRASIGTIHSFCSTVIRQHFHLLQIDPNVQMIAEEEGTLLRLETARDLFADRYETDSSGAFQRFVDHYGDGNDQTPRGRVIRAAAMLSSLVDPERWLATTRFATIEAADPAIALRDSTLGRQLFERIHAILKSTIERCDRILTKLRADDVLAKYADYTATFLSHLHECALEFGSGDLDKLAALVKGCKFDRMPTVKNLSTAQETLKAEMSAVRDVICKGELRDLCRFSAAEWRDGMARVGEPTGVFLDLIDEYRRRYSAAKSELRVLDFNDLERLALRVLRDAAGGDVLQPSPAAMSYQRRFKHVLVDEYQDVNEAQDAILTLVSRAGRFFCVGDVKQSIYRFRLAEPDRFLKRYDAYEPLRESSSAEVVGARIDLQTNFRSRANLLSTLNGVFSRLMAKATAEIDYDKSQYLHAAETSPYIDTAAHHPLVELHLLSIAAKEDRAEQSLENDDEDELDRTEREAALIAKRIRELLGKEGQPPLQIYDRMLKATRSIRAGDIAVLMRSMRFKAEQFKQTLNGRGVMSHCDSGSGFFETMEVRDLLALLKVLDNRRQDIPLAAVLRSPIAAIENAEDALATIRLAYPGRREAAVPFHEAVVRYAVEHDDALADQLRNLMKQLNAWRDSAQRRPLAEVIWQILDETKYLAFVEGLEDGAQRVANLVLLHDRARQFGTFRRQSLGRFMRFLDSLREESDLGAASVAAGADDVVRIMSVHASKGLEFPVVFVPDLGKRHNLRDAGGAILFDREAGIGLQVCDDERQIRYPSLASTMVSERLRRQMLAEEMRILYVAMTRAREKLILLGTCKEGTHDRWKQDWSSHTDALPTDAVLGGGCMLDWLGPAMAAMRADADLSFDIVTHPAGEDFGDPSKERRQSIPVPIQRLEPLTPAVPLSINADAAALWTRLTRPYRFDAFTREPATRAMTAASKSPMTPVDGRDTTAANADASQLLRRPRTLTAEIKPNAAEIGLATHAFFEHLDFHKEPDRSALEHHRDDLVARQILEPSVAALIDLASVEWMLQSEVGELLRTHADILLREVPINIAEPLPADDTLTPFCDRDLDRAVLRGRVDAIIPLTSGPIIIDFKTDRVSGDALERRFDLYRRQLELYSGALATLVGTKVKRAITVFLQARLIRDAI